MRNTRRLASIGIAIIATGALFAGTAGAANSKCTGSDLTPVPGIVRSDITCGAAAASLDPTYGGKSRALGAEAVLEPSVNNLLSTIQLVGPNGTGPANDAEKQIADGLN